MQEAALHVLDPVVRATVLPYPRVAARSSADQAVHEGVVVPDIRSFGFTSYVLGMVGREVLPETVVHAVDADLVQRGKIPGLFARRCSKT